MTDISDPSRFRPGDHMLLIDDKNREFMIVVPPEGESIRVRDREATSEELCQHHEGELLVLGNKRRYLIFRPTLRNVVMNMPRAAQVIYPKDLGMILFWADIAPGQKLCEIGVGHGALTMTLLRALGGQGSLTSYDIREDHLNRTRKNVALYLGNEALDLWTPVLADPGQEGLAGGPFQRVITDVPEPWDLLPAVTEALQPGGVWLCWLPTATQLGKFVEAINFNPYFCLPETFETLQRFWHVKPPSVRPTHEMKAHTGWIVLCRRRWRGPDFVYKVEDEGQEPAEQLEDVEESPANE